MSDWIQCAFEAWARVGLDDLNRAEDVLVEALEVCGGDPELLVIPRAGELHGIASGELGFELEGGDEADKARGRVDGVPIACDGTCVLEREHRIEDGLFGQAWRPAPKAGGSDEPQLGQTSGAIQAHGKNTLVRGSRFGERGRNDASGGVVFESVEIEVYTDSPGINQDRYVATPVPRGALVIVCDGAGGIRGGARAAECVTREIVIRAEHFDLSELERCMLTVDSVLQNERVYGETTCVALWVTSQEIYGVSTGDSEAWWVGDDAAVELTAKQSRSRLGTGISCVAAFRRLREGGRVVVGSDGLFAFAARERWLRVAREAPAGEVARRLVDVARLPSGRLQDDATVVVVSR